MPLTGVQALTIGTTPQNPPFNSRVDKNQFFYGFDIDIMDEICKRAKLKCEYTSVVFNDIFNALRAGKIDLANAAIIITQEREEDFLFSLPYLESNAQFIALQSSKIDNPKDIQNKRVGTRNGTPFKKLATSLYKDQINLVDFSSTADVLNALSSNQVDVVLMDYAAANYWVANSGNLYKLIGGPVPLGLGYGIMANKGQNALINHINKALLSMEADGTYLKIYERYF